MRVAVIDVGSNTARLLVATVDADDTDASAGGDAAGEGDSSSGCDDGRNNFAGSSARYPLRARTFTPGRKTLTEIARYLPSKVALAGA